MKNFTILIFGLTIFIGLSSCFQKINCDISKEKKLGNIEYSNQFKQFNIEASGNTISFSNGIEELIFIKNNSLEKRPQRLNDYKICESINIKPISAYAYYEYENLETVFQMDSAILVLSPEIEKLGNKRGESLYLNFSKEGVGTVKARVPISNIDTTITYQPFGELFKFNERITLGDQNFEDIWSFKSANLGIYYSKKSGVIALETNGNFFLRN